MFKGHYFAIAQPIGLSERRNVFNSWPRPTAKRFPHSALWANCLKVARTTAKTCSNNGALVKFMVNSKIGNRRPASIMRCRKQAITSSALSAYRFRSPFAD